VNSSAGEHRNTRGRSLSGSTSASSRVVLKPRRARPFFARHPWVFDTSIDRVIGEPSAGDVIDVVSFEGQFIARGLYNPASTIRVRLYRWDDGPLDEAFWARLLASAVRLRHEVLGLADERSACRLVFSEGDGLSGLTVDRFDRWLVAQFTSLALYGRRDLLLGLLSELTGALGIVARPERGIAQKEGLPAAEELTLGMIPDGPVEIVEHGLTYCVDLHRGQKTGFYLDQRDNRRQAARYCRDKRVLDLCCFSGGFSLNAAKNGGARVTLGVDSSMPAIELARRHAAMNRIDCARFQIGDVLEFLERLRSDRELFDVVICDPPKYARQAKDLERALKGYLRLNLAALDVLEPGGILVTCSCSGLIGRELFAATIGRVAEQSGRAIQILEQRGQPPDHPISATCLETEYLKCSICRVGA
jgi:23S rRNA (cytosine1962-C5)-methyltransferase